jgi:hypothetical protein
MAGYGQYLPHNNLTVAGTWNMPWGFTLSMNSTFITVTPSTPQVSNLILPGTVPDSGVTSEPLPGLAYGCLSAGCGKSTLAAAVSSYNSGVVGTLNAQGHPITGSVILPKNYSLGAPTISQDFRLTKVFTVKERYKFSILAEMFNAFNIANLTGYSSNLDVGVAGNVCQQGSVAPGSGVISCSYGQATQRAGQTFGSAGPRAVQVGARFTF